MGFCLISVKGFIGLGLVLPLVLVFEAVVGSLAAKKFCFFKFKAVGDLAVCLGGTVLDSSGCDCSNSSFFLSFVR